MTPPGGHYNMLYQRWFGSSLDYRGDCQRKEGAAGSVAEDGDLSQ